jgi:hypothetical protein
MYYEATFKPSKPSDYNEEAESLAGKTIAIQQGWVLDDGPHKGQQCYYVPNTTIGTIPESHLENIQPVSYTKWRTTHKHLGFGD